MIKIGDLAQRAQVTVKTLHHYDDIGLLKPAHVDPQTGYRLYAPKQEDQLHRIVALKDLGLSLEQIGHLLNRDLTETRVQTVLQEKHTDLRHELRNVQARLTRVEKYLKMGTNPSESTPTSHTQQSKKQKQENTMSHIQQINTNNFAEFLKRLEAGRKHYLPMIFGTSIESTQQTTWLDQFDDQYAYLIVTLPHGECTYVLRRADHRAAIWFSLILPSHWDQRFDLVDASIPHVLTWFNEQDTYRYFYAQLGLDNTPPTFLESFLPSLLKHGFNTEYRMNMHRAANLPAPDPLPLPKDVEEVTYTDNMRDEVIQLAHEVYTAEGVNYSLENARRCVERDIASDWFHESATFLRTSDGSLIGAIWWGVDEEPHLGEFLVAKPHQGKGYGKYLLNKTIRHIKRRFPQKSIRLGTCREWARARSLYETYHFVPDQLYTNLNLHKLPDGKS